MSTVLPTSLSEKTRSIARMQWPNWTREPLLHFVVLGALLFTVDHFIAGRADDPHTILIDASVDKQAREVFKAARGHEPNADELYALRRVWLDNEVLYREGLALQVDKALSVVDAGLKLPPVDEKLLRDWFERNRAKYDEPARFDFEEAVFAGDTSEAALRDFASALNTGAQNDAKAGLRVFKGRPQGNLEQSYGEAFVKALQTSPPGEWRAFATRDGLHVMRLQSIAPARPAVFENLGGVVLQDWTDAVMADQRTAAVRTLAKKYTVKVEATAK
jgi:PPIC-type PPIASE domain